ncbi:hypothetical protein H0H92_010835 [Tricholoma furcatifolium]|nr:hypothetical protein H0H92_010835 [Tricholoma furcatifolium]
MSKALTNSDINQALENIITTWERKSTCSKESELWSRANIILQRKLMNNAATALMAKDNLDHKNLYNCATYALVKAMAENEALFNSPPDSEVPPPTEPLPETPSPKTLSSKVFSSSDEYVDTRGRKITRKTDSPELIFDMSPFGSPGR